MHHFVVKMLVKAASLLNYPGPDFYVQNFPWGQIRVTFSFSLNGKKLLQYHYHLMTQYFITTDFKLENTVNILQCRVVSTSCCYLHSNATTHASILDLLLKSKLLLKKSYITISWQLVYSFNTTLCVSPSSGDLYV